MRYRIVESDWGKEIIIDDDTKKLNIYYGGNLDLNWQIIDKTADGLINTASITIKEGLQSFYQELQQLFNKLERVKIYDTEEDDEENRLLEYRENNIRVLLALIIYGDPINIEFVISTILMISAILLINKDFNKEEVKK